MAAAVYDRGLVMGFTEEIEQAAQDLKKRSKQMIEDERPNRRDLRDLDVFTIDPADAKDFDDALSARKLPNGNYEIGVHIADPSFFVKFGDTIDKEARQRGTSIYLVDRTIPMLPEVLSNDLCSLNADEEKMVFSALFELDENGKVINE
jgi:ribonuclease R